ncbi:MAG TPA: type II toxin-antitoxin system ParD family antitoxin [Candidatus Saccharimonadales bacterium]|jgi:putative addiction module CopG family antidote|nr:type II toxin-antitoxin system ParD family antitoxin [Candidatus Saccharimonadales bacterium]
MPIEQMNVSLSPQMARFIRDKVRKGEYTNISEVVRDAVRRMQEEDARRKERELLSSFESRLTKEEHDGIRRGVQQGIRDIEEGRYVEYDADGLRNLATNLVGASVKKLSRRHKVR